MKVLATLLVLLLGSFSSASEVEWQYKKDVNFKSLHDPGRLYLENGTIIRMDYKIYNLKSEGNWESGKLLHIVYKPETGAVLLEPQSGEFVAIKEGLKSHPIDFLLEKKLEKARSNMDYRFAFQEITELWDIEIHRAYNSLLTYYRSRMEEREALEEEDVELYDKSGEALAGAQEQWIRFRDAERAAIYRLRTAEQGRLRLIDGDADVMNLSKSRALSLASMPTL